MGFGVGVADQAGVRARKLGLGLGSYRVGFTLCIFARKLG